MNTRRIFLECQLSQGSFSGEVVFEVNTIDEGKYVGVAPRRDCFSMNGRVFGINELPKNDKTVDGKVATRLVANGGEVARVALPDGETIRVSVALISERESEMAHVPV
jgi:hypothetical protein